jgi:hypothetical protein
MCQTTGHTICAKQQDTLYVPNNRTHCMCQTTGHTVCANQQDTLYVPNNRTHSMCQTTGHITCTNQHSGENKPHIQLRKYQSSDMTTSHFISVHTHTIISFGSDMLLYFHVCICLLDWFQLTYLTIFTNLNDSSTTA